MPQPGLFPRPKLAPYNPDRLREWVRALVTGSTISIFVYVIAFYLFQTNRATDASWPHIEAAMHAILPSVTSILGTALGFYFGSQKR